MLHCVKSPKKSKATILIIALLFLTMMSLFVLIAMRNSQLELIMTRHYQERAEASLAAENALAQAKKVLEEHATSREGKVKYGKFQITFLEEHECEMDYLIEAVGKIVRAKVTIEARYQVPRPGCAGTSKLFWQREY